MWGQTRTSRGDIQYIFYYFLYGIYFPLHLSVTKTVEVDRFSIAPLDCALKILLAAPL
ncbi:hypothetical protein UCMB321_2688 [Pseudomonas batumici]|uniref:Uncharacterized protein n=1 Tax=Pseudomonas batumici TaxID=226910 RepID=A0A0C2IF65_9PSED|nr:hypothetical protein UCMB321_2688 [Pseudomonas batumici]